MGRNEVEAQSCVGSARSSPDNAAAQAPYTLIRNPPSYASHPFGCFDFFMFFFLINAAHHVILNAPRMLNKQFPVTV